MPRPPLDLVVQRAAASGASKQYSDIALDPARRSADLEFTTKIGTGHEAGSFSTGKDGQTRLLQSVRFVGLGGSSVAFQGFVSGEPEEATKTVQATGYWAKLKDAHFTELYIDQDISKWGEMSLNERVRLVGNPTRHFSWTAAQGGIICELPNESIPSGAYTATWYAAPVGALVKSVKYNGSNTSLPAGIAAATMNWNANDSQDGTVEVENLTLDSTERTATADTARRYVAIPVFNSGGATTPSVGANRKFTSLKVYGDHGLSTITASEVIKNAISRACPGITYDSDSIQDSSTTFDQLVFENTTVEDVVARVNAAHLWHPAVWGTKFHYGPANDLNDYDYELSKQGDMRATLEPSGDAVTDEGPFNGCWVYYQDVAAGGRPSRVGPLGSGVGQDPEGDALLTDTTPENPCNLENFSRNAKIEIGFPTTRAQAIIFGSIYLAEHNLPNQQGSGSATGWVKNRAGALVPAWQIRAGDRVRYTDSDRIYRVYGTRYNQTTRRVELSFDNAGFTLDAIFERIGIKLSAIQQ